MKYYKIVITIDRTESKFVYYAKTNSLIPLNEFKSYFTHILAMDFQEIKDLDEEDTFSSSFTEIKEEEFFDECFIDYEHARPIYKLMSLVDISNVYIVVYRSFSKRIDETPEYFLVEGIVDGEDISVTSIGNTINSSREEVIENCHKDICQQLRRYFTVSGVDLLRGVMQIFSIGPEQYSVEYEDRQLVLD